MIQFNLEKIKILIGLGNPAEKYNNTYHNLGHIFIDYLKNKSSNLPFKTYKTKNYMNLSGLEILKIIKEKKIKPAEIIIIHDEIDLKIGQFKLSFNKSAAGHKGIENIIQTLKTKEFWRLRIGIHPNTNQKIKAEKIVLSQISKENKIILNETFEKIILNYFNLT